MMDLSDLDTLFAPQGSPEWLAQRCGKATASEFHCILAKAKDKAKGPMMRTAYLRRLVAERLTGKPTELYTKGYADHLERGKEQEPHARLAYEALTGNIVRQVGFLHHGQLMCGCSPDGLLVELPGGVEIKSVIPTVQIETIMSASYPPEHKAQIQGSMMITGCDFWDFCSFSPDLPDNLQCYTYRVLRDNDYIAGLEAAVTLFLQEVADYASVLRGMSLPMPGAPR